MEGLINRLKQEVESLQKENNELVREIKIQKDGYHNVKRQLYDEIEEYKKKVSQLMEENKMYKMYINNLESNIDDQQIYNKEIPFYDESEELENAYDNFFE